MTIIEPIEYHKEERLVFKAGRLDVVVVSGYAQIAAPGDDDQVYKDYEVRLTVGPWFKNVYDVSPLVTPAGFTHHGSDEDDNSGQKIYSYRWDTVGGTGDYIDEERIRIKVRVDVLGEGRFVNLLGYQLTAITFLGHEGINSP